MRTLTTPAAAAPVNGWSGRSRNSSPIKWPDLRTLLAAIPVAAWGEPVSGPEAAFRNKAKMVVSGSVERPLLGMLHRDGTPVDLTDCPLYPAEFAPVFATLKPPLYRPRRVNTLQRRAQTRGAGHICC